MHRCLAMLWEDDEHFTTHHIDALIGTDNLSMLQSILPQLVYYEGPAQANIHTVLLRKCETSSAFAYELYWLLLAHPRLREEDGEPAASHSLSAVHVQATDAPPWQHLDSLLSRIVQTMECRQESHHRPVEARSSAFERQVELVDKLTRISEALRTVPKAERLASLRAALAQLNSTLPPIDSNTPLPMDCSPFLPILSMGSAPHRILRFVDSEGMWAFSLSAFPACAHLF